MGITCIIVTPSDTEFVELTHPVWEMNWGIQFPEIVVASDAVAKHITPTEPDWVKRGPQTWCYELRFDEDYVARTRALVGRDERREPIYPLIAGVRIRAEIAGLEDRVHLSLTLTNESSQTLERVYSDGGCVHPLSDAFCRHDPVGRAFVMCDGRMMSMAYLDRTRASCCAYWHDPAGYEQPVERSCEPMWGRSTARIDEPAILGMVSVDRSKAYALGYQCAGSALSNSSGHSCLHSRPRFGDLAPGQRVTRHGCVMFGSDLDSLADLVRSALVGDKSA